MKFFITGSLFLAIIAIGFGIQQNITEPQGQEYISRVKLKTDCEVDPSSFAIKNIESGDVRPFAYGEAFIRAKDDHTLQVVMKEDYSNVILDGITAPAARNLNLFQTCDNQRNIFKVFQSMNEQFGNS